MMLSLFEQIKQLDLDEFELMERAYEHEYGTTGYVISDYCTFVQHGIMPQYLINYLLFLRRTT